MPQGFKKRAPRTWRRQLSLDQEAAEVAQIRRLLWCLARLRWLDLIDPIV